MDMVGHSVEINSYTVFSMAPEISGILSLVAHLACIQILLNECGMIVCF